MPIYASERTGDFLNAPRPVGSKAWIPTHISLTPKPASGTSKAGRSPAQQDPEAQPRVKAMKELARKMRTIRSWEGKVGRVWAVR